MGTSATRTRSRGRKPRARLRRCARNAPDEDFHHGLLGWQSVLCETNTTREVVHSIQRALKKDGFYTGPVDGIIGTQTMAGVRSFQKSKGLPQGFLTLETIRSLGISLN